MKRLPIGEQHLVPIIENNKLYVDKTKLVYQLMQGSKYYFLARPRRFGKSLLVDTLKQVFLGNQSLFKGLWIEERIDWKTTTHPVIHIDFSKLSYSNRSLNSAISQKLIAIAQQYKVNISGIDCKELFDDLIEQLALINDVVILIDEYDKPITDYLMNRKEAVKQRDTLRDFFGVLKSLGDKIRMVFITGISKFSKVSLFSVLNNITDITLRPDYATLTGITQQELLHYFDAHITATAQHWQWSKDDLLVRIKEMYNGYSWDGKQFVYNPFSLLNFFDSKQLDNYWFKTGTPAFLVKLLKKQRLTNQHLEKKVVRSAFFEIFDIENNLDVYSLLFQTGYLTIKHIRQRRFVADYTLGYPNREVYMSFTHHLLQAYTDKKPTTVSAVAVALEDALVDRDIKGIQKQLNILFGNIAYQLFPFEKKEKTPTRQQQEFIAWEGYFHTVIYLTLQYLGITVQCEISKHKGRLDAVVEVDDYIYIMEFKLEDAEKALQQIKGKQYAQSYQNTTKKILLLGIAFDQKNRRVKDIAWEEMVNN